MWKSRIVLLEKLPSKEMNMSSSAEDKIPFPCGWHVCSDLNHHLNLDCQYRNIYLASKQMVSTGVIEEERGEVEDRVSKNTIAGPAFSSSSSSSSSTSSQISVVTNPNAIGFKRISEGHVVAFKDVIKATKGHDQFDRFADATAGEGADSVYCEFCSLELTRSDMDLHQRFDCQDVSIFCPSGCGFKTQRRLIAEHLASKCRLREVQCPNGCDHYQVLWQEDLEEHLANRCQRRLVPCSLGCDASDLVSWFTCLCVNHCLVLSILVFRCLYVCLCMCVFVYLSCLNLFA